MMTKSITTSCDMVTQLPDPFHSSDRSLEGRQNKIWRFAGIAAFGSGFTWEVLLSGGSLFLPYKQ